MAIMYPINKQNIKQFYGKLTLTQILPPYCVNAFKLYVLFIRNINIDGLLEPWQDKSLKPLVII